MAVKKGNEIPTIDVSLVTLQVGDGDELALDTANQIQVEVQTETEEAVKLIVKGILRAQKLETVTITGNQITLTDNVFNPEMVTILQGGTIQYWGEAAHTTKVNTDAGYGVASYSPPVVGSNSRGSVFTLRAYSAIYNAAGQITGYEKITYPNCQGVPVALNSQDNVFRAPEYTINSAPNNNEAPYTIDYVSALPSVS